MIVQKNFCTLASYYCKKVYTFAKNLKVNFMNEQETSMALASFLLQIKAIKLNPANPFTWASGLKSPIYCDNRVTLSYPQVRTFIREGFVKMCLDKFGKPDVIAGVATGGIPQGALVAQELGLPFVYVRSEKKSHGMNNQIEGVINSGQSVVIIEDLVSTGKSSLNAVEALREKGAVIKGMLAIFTYGMEVATENFKNNKCELFTLSNYNALIQKAAEESYIREDDLASLIEWKNNPQAWSDARM
jgi:orotate phosphoribosyltransferase